MASGEFSKNNFIIDKSLVKFHEIIGKRGSESEVWSADLTLPSGETCKVAAKKVFRADVKEVQMMKKLQHRNIIMFYGIIQLEPNESSIIMELAENGNLRHYLDERRMQNQMRLPKEMMWKWVYEAACGLDHLHKIDHTHRDIKSLNYLIMKDFTLKLGDLGLATALDITRGTSGMRGTCRWMAPEVIKMQKRSVKSDVFSYGTVVWEICTMDIPYADKRGDFQVMNAICSGQRPGIPEDVPQQLKKMIHLCWDDDYHHRPDMGFICKMLQTAIKEDNSLEELTQQLQQTAIHDDEPQDIEMEPHTPATSDHAETSSIAADAAISISRVLKLAQGMPAVENLSKDRDLLSNEYVSPDPTIESDSSVAMYKWCAVPRGVCLVINNVDFSQARDNGHESMCDREGSEVDCKKLKQLFTKFKFDVRVKQDLTSTQLTTLLKKVGSEDHSSANAFVCCILTHGKVGKIAGCDGEYITICDILNDFTKEKCSSLSEKPKLFFVQACQGGEPQEKHDLPMDAVPSSPTPSTGVGIGMESIIPNEVDFLLSFSTVPGHVSYRDTKEGSWFIDALIGKIRKLYETEDLLSILTAVNHKMSKKSSLQSGVTLGQTPLPVNTLCKKVYFTKWETVSEKQTQASCQISQKGGMLSLPNIGISLEIPADALPDNTNDVNMTMSLYQEYKDYPDIDANHLMITPIVSCQPEGIVFKHPARLTLPHSVTRFKSIKSGDFKPTDGDNIHLWFKSNKGVWQKLPSKLPHDSPELQPFWLNEITETSIHLEVKHFCNFALSVGEPADMTILMYMHPSIIADDTNAVYVSVYAVQESWAELIRQKLKPVSIMCANESKLTVLPNEEKLDITLKNISPSPGWVPPDAGFISYKKLKRGNEGTRKEFVFERKLEQNPKTIRGLYDITQKGNDEDELEDLFFDQNMFHRSLSTQSFDARLVSDFCESVSGSVLPMRSPETSEGEVQPVIGATAAISCSALLLPRQVIQTINIDELLPHTRDLDTKGKLQLIDNCRQLLARTEITDTLLPVLTENMLDYFSTMHADDKQMVRNAFKRQSQKEAAEMFLSRILRLGNGWPSELFDALQAAGCVNQCRNLGEEYQRCFQQHRKRPQAEEVFLPPKPHAGSYQYDTSGLTKFEL